MWWNKEVRECIRGKRLSKNNWDNQRNEENRQEYKDMCRKIKSCSQGKRKSVCRSV